MKSLKSHTGRMMNKNTNSNFGEYHFFFKDIQEIKQFFFTFDNYLLNFHFRNIPKIAANFNGKSLLALLYFKSN